MGARRHHRRRSRPSADVRADPSPSGRWQRWTDLQQRAGNAAVASLVRVNRDGPQQPLDLSPRAAALLRPPPDLLRPTPIPERVRAAITAWLQSRKLGITMQVDAGNISMPEVVASIRDEVAGAGRVDAYQVAQVVRDVLGRQAPPETRGRQTPMGRESELLARLKNALGKKVQVGGDDAKLVVSVSGLVATAKVAGAEAKVEGGTGGVKGTVKKGPVTATAAPSAFALKTSIPMGSATGVFAAKLSRSKGSWSKWSVSFSFPVVGGKPIDARPAVDALRSSVLGAEAAFRDIAGHLRAGGSPGDDYVVERIGRITPAIKQVGSAVKERKGPNVSVRIGAGGGPREVGGRSVQESTVGVSLVVEF